MNVPDTINAVFEPDDAEEVDIPVSDPKPPKAKKAAKKPSKKKAPPSKSKTASKKKATKKPSKKPAKAKTEAKGRRGIRKDGKPRRKPRTNPARSPAAFKYGRKVAKLRTAKKLTQYELATKAKISQPGLANIERGVAGASEEMRAKLVKVLGKAAA